MRLPGRWGALRVPPPSSSGLAPAHAAHPALSTPPGGRKTEHVSLGERGPCFVRPQLARLPCHYTDQVPLTSL